jgi:hypothetical protein
MIFNQQKGIGVHEDAFDNVWPEISACLKIRQDYMQKL